MKNLILLIALTFAALSHAATKVPISMISGLDYIYVEAASSSHIPLPSGTTTNIVYEIEITDTANSYNPATGVFVSPIDSVYGVCGGLTLVGVSSSTGRIITNIFKNGAGFVSSRTPLVSTAGAEAYGEVCYYMKLLSGETVNISAYQDSGSSKSLATSNSVNRLTIIRIPGKF